jgi:hypothetical protein
MKSLNPINLSTDSPYNAQMNFMNFYVCRSLSCHSYHKLLAMDVYETTLQIL